MMTNESAGMFNIPLYICYSLLILFIDLVQILTEITGDLESDIAVKHAIKLMKAWSFGNYYRFFQLYPSTPHYGRHLVDLFMERQKRNALRTLSKAYVYFAIKCRITCNKCKRWGGDVQFYLQIPE